ncbi:MAG: PAS domain S-box protein, partial [Thermomicrobiales bacterium]
MLQSAFGSVLSWTGRIAQYLGSAYLLAAAIIAMRETRDWVTPLEAALGETRQQFKEMFDLAADGIVVHELLSATGRGNFLQANPAICALLGYTLQEMQNLTPLDIMAPEDRQFVPEDTEVLCHDNLLRHEKILLTKNGQRIPVEISTRQYRQQNRTMMLSMIRDVTERKRTEEAIRESEQFKQAILDAMTSHIAVLDREGNIVAVNRAWCAFALANSGEAGRTAPHTGIGVNYLDICRMACGASAEGALEMHNGIKVVLEGKAEIFSHEYPCHSPQVERWFNVTVTPLREKAGGAVVSHIDITASRQLMDELRG